MRTWKSKLLSLFIPLLGLVLSQGKIYAQNVPPPPDCVIVVNNFTSAGSTATFPNYFTACQTWTLQYTSVGFTGLTITVQSAPAATPTTPGSWTTFAGTVVTGSNPNTSTTGAVATLKNGTVDIPFIRVTLSGLTGSGTVFGVLYGYKTGYAGSGSGGGGSITCMSADGVLYGSMGACDTNLTWDATTGLLVNKPLTALNYNTVTNCADSAGAAACGSAAAGAFVVDVSSSSTVVSTTAVTANSEILITFDAGLGTRLGITCNSVVPPSYFVSARTAGASFTLTSSAPMTNPACFNYSIIN